MMKDQKLKGETLILVLIQNKEKQTQTEPWSKKKKILLTGDSMVNGISKNCDLSRRYKSKDSRETGWHNQGKARKSYSSCWN